MIHNKKTFNKSSCLKIGSLHNTRENFCTSVISARRDVFTRRHFRSATLMHGDIFARQHLYTAIILRCKNLAHCYFFLHFYGIIFAGVTFTLDYIFSFLLFLTDSVLTVTSNKHFVGLQTEVKFCANLSQ